MSRETDLFISRQRKTYHTVTKNNISVSIDSKELNTHYHSLLAPTNFGDKPVNVASLVLIYSKSSESIFWLQREVKIKVSSGLLLYFNTSLILIRKANQWMPKDICFLSRRCEEAWMTEAPEEKRIVTCGSEDPDEASEVYVSVSE